MFNVPPIPVVCSLLLPFLITSAALMFGNWSQHIFVSKRGADGIGNTHRHVTRTNPCVGSMHTM